MADQVPNVPGGPHLRTVAMLRDTNPSGHIFGGWTLSQMDLAGGTYAARKIGGRCSSEHEDDTSLAVKIETWSQGRDGSDAEKVTQGVFTYVTVDDGKPRSFKGE
jgi:acyl-CoA thioesterase YciA